MVGNPVENHLHYICIPISVGIEKIWDREAALPSRLVSRRLKQECAYCTRAYESVREPVLLIIKDLLGSFGKMRVFRRCRIDLFHDPDLGRCGPRFLAAMAQVMDLTLVISDDLLLGSGSHLDHEELTGEFEVRGPRPSRVRSLRRRPPMPKCPGALPCGALLIARELNAHRRRYVLPFACTL